MVKTVMYIAFLAYVLVQTANCDPLKPRQEETPKPIEHSHKIDDNYSIKWTIDEAAGTIKFETTAKTEGWVGLGFNKAQPVMDKAELVIAGFKAGVNPSTTVAPTTPAPEDSTTPAPEDSTTPAPEESTTPAPEDSTTPAPEDSADENKERSSFRRAKRADPVGENTYVRVFSATDNTPGAELVNSKWEAEATEAGGSTSLTLTRNLGLVSENGDIIDFADKEATVNVLWSYSATDDWTAAHTQKGTFSINLYKGDTSGASSITNLSIMSSLITAIFAIRLF